MPLTLRSSIEPWHREARAERVGAAPFPTRTTVQIRPWLLRPTTRFSRRAELLLLKENCLMPWFQEGDAVFFDRTLEPKDGDVCVFETYYENRSDGAQFLLKSVKQFRSLQDGSRWLICGQGFLPATDIEILGVVVGTHRLQWWKRPRVRDMQFTLPVTVGYKSAIPRAGAG